MAELILNGYLINRLDYQTFDEVLTFLGEDNKKYVCLSLGSRKIESKNSRNLFYGCKTEFQLLESRTEGKMSKFKKSVLLEEPVFEYEADRRLIVLNDVISNINNLSFNTYEFYTNKLRIIKDNSLDTDSFILIILKEFCDAIGITLDVNRCTRCGSHILKTVSFKHLGMLCNICTKELFVKPFEVRFNKLIYLLFNNKFDEIHHYYDLFPYAIKNLKQFVFDTAGIKLTSLNEY